MNMRDFKETNGFTEFFSILFLFGIFAFVACGSSYLYNNYSGDDFTYVTVINQNCQ